MARSSEIYITVSFITSMNRKSVKSGKSLKYRKYLFMASRNLSLENLKILFFVKKKEN